jgi:lipoate-protein ligase A
MMRAEENDECGMMNDERPLHPPTHDRVRSSFIIHRSSFSLLLDLPASGAWNMAVDEALLEAAAAEGQCALRFYQWEEPTLSLGYFQTCADRLRHPASAGCPLVRRPSGGGAILHDLELTYSLAVPERHPLAASRLQTYKLVHQSLIEALERWGIEAKLFARGTAALGCVTGSPQPRAAVPHPFLCFQRRSPGDVLVGDVKIAGSAQRRCRGAVLQHGSLLLARSHAAPELDGLKELSGRAIRVEELIQAWLEKLAGALNITWRQVGLAEQHQRRAARLVADKYGAAAWTNVR